MLKLLLSWCEPYSREEFSTKKARLSVIYHRRNCEFSLLSMDVSWKKHQHQENKFKFTSISISVRIVSFCIHMRKQVQTTLNGCRFPIYCFLFRRFPVAHSCMPIRLRYSPCTLLYSCLCNHLPPALFFFHTPKSCDSVIHGRTTSVAVHLYLYPSNNSRYHSRPNLASHIGNTISYSPRQRKNIGWSIEALARQRAIVQGVNVSVCGFDRRLWHLSCFCVNL